MRIHENRVFFSNRMLTNTNSYLNMEELSIKVGLSNYGPDIDPTHTTYTPIAPNSRYTTYYPTSFSDSASAISLILALSSALRLSSLSFSLCNSFLSCCSLKNLTPFREYLLLFNGVKLPVYVILGSQGIGAFSSLSSAGSAWFSSMSVPLPGYSSPRVDTGEGITSRIWGADAAFLSLRRRQNQNPPTRARVMKTSGMAMRPSLEFVLCAGDGGSAVGAFAGV